MLDSLNRGYYYLAGGALFIALSLSPIPWLARIVLLWIGASILWFGVAYLTSRGGLLFKTSEGRLPIGIKALLFPVLFGVTVYNYIARANANQPAIQELREGIWVGRRLLPSDEETIRESRIGAILDVTAEFDTLPRSKLPADVAYLNVPVMDHEPLNLAQLRRAVNWIHQQRKAGKEVLIHCALGQGRSVMAILAYFKALNPDRAYDELMAEIKPIRVKAGPNARQMALLREFAELDQQLEKLRVCVIVNPAAGKENEQDIGDIKQILTPFLNLSVKETTPEISGDQRAREAMNETFDQILVYGGDGTVAEVASELMETETPLGIIPGGTSNSLAASLYGNAARMDRVRSACHHILQGQVEKMDAARSDHGNFFLLAGIGLEAGMTEKADRQSKDEMGPLAYLLGGLEQMNEQDIFDATLTIDGDTFSYQTGSVVIANAAPTTSILAQGSGEVDFQDGFLEVTVIRSDRGESLTPKALAELITGTSDNENGSAVHRHKGKTIKVEAEPPQTIVIDGEVRNKTPIEIKCAPASLRVLRAPGTTIPGSS